MESNPSETIALVFGGFLTLLSAVSAFILFIKAAFAGADEEGDVDDANALILAIVVVASGIVAMILVPGARFGFGIFCLILAGLAGLALSFKAAANAAHGSGGAILLLMLLTSLVLAVR